MASSADASSAPVGQIGDGQVQNQPSRPACPVTVVSSEVPHVTVIGDGQPQAPKAKRAHEFVILPPVAATY